MAGLTAAEMDVVEPYDSFTSSAVIQLEDLGFCKRGEGGTFVEGGRLAPGGELPAMTSGGGLSYCHPGALGILLLVELTRQLRGEAGERQVAAARVGVAHAVGGLMSTAATVILAGE
jgi:acetyl-CoA acetyltransferase